MNPELFLVETKATLWKEVMVNGAVIYCANHSDPNRHELIFDSESAIEIQQNNGETSLWFIGAEAVEAYVPEAHEHRRLKSISDILHVFEGKQPLAHVYLNAVLQTDNGYIDVPLGCFHIERIEPAPYRPSAVLLHISSVN